MASSSSSSSAQTRTPPLSPPSSSPPYQPSTATTPPPSSQPSLDLPTERPDLTIKPPPTPSTFTQTPNPLITIRASEDGKGLGVFALTDIPAGSTIIFEPPLLTLPRSLTEPPLSELPVPDPLDAIVASLSVSERETYLSLCPYSRDEEETMNRAIFYSNGYSIEDDTTTGVFTVASRVNHSCVPNSHFEWREVEGGGGKGLLIWNSWRLMAGEEVTVDYGHKSGGGGGLRGWYGFVCACGACTDGESEDEDEGEVDINRDCQ